MMKSIILSSVHAVAQVLLSWAASSSEELAQGSLEGYLDKTYVIPQ